MQFQSQPKKEKLKNTNREYNIKVLVDKKTFNVKDQKTTGEFFTYQTSLFYLVPQQSTEATMFFDAWLPDININPVTKQRQWPEIAVQISYPISTNIRCAVQRKSEEYPASHHIIVMSKDVEEHLDKMVGKYLFVKVLPEKETEKVLE